MTPVTRSILAATVLVACGAWQWEHPVPHASSIAARAERGGRVIAVGARGAILVADGARWRVLASGVADDLRAIVATDRAWLVAGDGGTLLRSLDGATFEARPTGIRTALVALVAERDQVVALAADGTLLRSSDGGDSFTTLAGVGAAGQRATALAIAPGGVVIGTSGGLWRGDRVDGTFTTVAAEPIESLEVGAGGAVTALARSRVVYHSQIICNSCVDFGYQVVARYRSRDTKRWRRKTVEDPVTTRRGWGPPVAPVPPATPPVTGWGGPGGYQAPVVMPAWPRPGVTPAAPQLALLALAATPGGELFAAGADGTVMARDGKGRWRRLTTPTGAGQRLTGIAALDDRRLVVVGDGGVILQSTDGGAHFQHRATDRLDDLTAVWGAGDQVVAAGRGLIARSADGGATWETLEVDLPEVDRLWGRGPELWAVGSGVHRSRDGGTTWTAVHDGWFTGVWGDGARVFAVGHDGAIVVTADHGATWRSPASGTTAHLRDLWGRGDDLWVVGGDSSQGAVLRSRDGGHTWHDALVPTRASMFAVTGTADRVFVLGAGGAILRGEP